MTLRRVNPEELAPPIGFSHAVVAEGTKIVFLAGQTALDSTGKVVGQTIVEQFRVALTNILTALSAAGGTPAQLAKLTIYSVDPENYRANAREISAVWKELVGRDYPAMALVGVVRLWDIEAQVEIEGIAVLP
ncbi:RutC family protein [mine drainage metagenome]|uniref:RutC family protein n=1 Tax=mine drainage metagenome TaxID=410659 RepID=A0A1J5QIP2_9ZZZZ